MFVSLNNNPNSLIHFTLDGKEYRAQAGISVAAAILQVTAVSRHTVISGQQRGPYCMMGVCFDCLMCIDGEPNQQACMITLQPGMNIETQTGARQLDRSAHQWS